jgi:GNAT superfamily N-acetyltransferase
VTVRLAHAGDIDVVAEVVSTAYADDAWVAWVVTPDRRQERVRALQVSILSAVALPHGEVWLCENDAGAVVGAALWLLADRHVPPEAWAAVAATEAEMMGERRPFAAEAAAATRGLRPTTPHHLLASLGVLPTERGRGIGSALLAPVLERSDRDGVVAYLETSAEDNLRFYGRLGFELVGNVQLPNGGPPVWALLRTPSPTAG